MYKCGFCKKTSKPRASCHKVVIQTQIWHHPFRPKVQKKWGFDKMGRYKLEWADDPGGTGKQIMQEVSACAECADKWEKEHENIR